MDNESKSYGYVRVATFDQADPELKQQIGAICLLQSLGYCVALAPKDFDGNERKLNILPIIADLEADSPVLLETKKLLQAESMLVIKGFSKK